MESEKLQHMVRLHGHAQKREGARLQSSFTSEVQKVIMSIASLAQFKC